MVTGGGAKSGHKTFWACNLTRNDEYLEISRSKWPLTCHIEVSSCHSASVRDVIHIAIDGFLTFEQVRVMVIDVPLCDCNPLLDCSVDLA